VAVQIEREQASELTEFLGGNSGTAIERVRSFHVSSLAPLRKCLTTLALVYNLCNTILSLYKLIKGEYQFLPMLEIAVEESKCGRVRILWGHLMWDGMTHPQSPQVIDEVYGNLNRFWAAVQFGETHIYEEQVIKGHGFTYELFEFVIEEKNLVSVNHATITDGKVTREPIGKSERYDVLKFTEQNRTYLRSLFSLIASSSSGI
jgi:hypothetical protein